MYLVAIVISTTVRSGKMQSGNVIEWTREKDLKQGKSGHRSISYFDSIFFVGGPEKQNVEKWMISDGFISSELLDIEVLSYYQFPELLLVRQDYFGTC